MSNIIDYEEYARLLGEKYENMMMNENFENLNIMVNKLQHLYLWHIQDEKKNPLISTIAAQKPIPVLPLLPPETQEDLSLLIADASFTRVETGSVSALSLPASPEEERTLSISRRFSAFRLFLTVFLLWAKSALFIERNTSLISEGTRLFSRLSMTTTALSTLGSG